MTSWALLTRRIRGSGEDFTPSNKIPRGGKFAGHLLARVVFPEDTNEPMGFNTNITEFGGLPVRNYKPDEKPKYGEYAYRFSQWWDDKDSIEDRLQAYLNDPGSAETTALILGNWADDGPTKLVDLLIKEAGKLPNLRALFMGEVTYEENEISWIQQTDYTGLLNAFPGLEELWVRGADGLKLSEFRHISLKCLVFESGGLPKAILESVAKSVIPEMEHLEFYTGTDEYGWDGEAEDLRPFLYDNPFPKLTYLGLRNCENVNEVAELVAKAPVLDQLEVLDLSLGNLRDEGARALLDSEGIRKLKKLDLHYHFMSDEVVAAFEALPIEVDVSDVQDPYEYDDEEPDYYISVTE